MGIEKPYQPSPEEMKKAEKIMTKKQKEKSEEREEGFYEKIEKTEQEAKEKLITQIHKEYVDAGVSEGAAEKLA